MDHLNSQPLVPGVGFFQTTFGLGSVRIPPDFVSDEEVADPPGVGGVVGSDGPRMCSGKVAVTRTLSKESTGTIVRPGPRIGSIKIKS